MCVSLARWIKGPSAVRGVFIQVLKCVHIFRGIGIYSHREHRVAYDGLSSSSFRFLPFFFSLLGIHVAHYAFSCFCYFIFLSCLISFVSMYIYIYEHKEIDFLKKKANEDDDLKKQEINAFALIHRFFLKKNFHLLQAPIIIIMYINLCMYIFCCGGEK